jgi:hypothetical protein
MLVYIIKCSDTKLFKVGITEDFVTRISNMHVDNPFPIYAVCVISTENARDVESNLHNYLEPYRWQGEWFRLSSKEVNKVVGKMKKLGRLVYEDRDRPKFL